MSGPDWQTLERWFREWYRATPADGGEAERQARILAAVRSAPPPSRMLWRRLPLAARLIGTAGLAASLVALALGMRWWQLHRGASSAGHDVQFVFVAPTASNVAIVGDFNGWDASATPMRRGGPADPWVATVTVPRERRMFTYAFIVDGTHWMADPNAPLASTDDFGSATSVLVLHDRRAM